MSNKLAPSPPKLLLCAKIPLLLLPSSAAAVIARTRKMPVSGEGDQSPSSSSSPCTLHFIVRATSKSLSIRAASHETIQSLITRIAAAIRLPMGLLRLLYGKRHLPSDWTLARCKIENGTILQLVLCFEDLGYSLPWKVANDILLAINDLISIRSDFESNKVQQIVLSIDAFIKQFILMTPTGDGSEAVCHLQLFIDSGAHIALGKLYHSPLQFHRKVADYAVRLFLRFNNRELPRAYCIGFVPVLLLFCKLFAGTAGKRDSLYLHCQRTLGLMLYSNGWNIFKELTLEASHQ